MVRDELVRLGFNEDEIEGGGLRVTTTFTQKAMDAAQEGVAEVRPRLRGDPGREGQHRAGFGDKDLHIGVASVEPGTGAVRGIFGGQDYLDSQINWAVAGGQAGSTMKPAALVAAIEDGFSLKDTFEGNSPIVLPDGTDFENQGDADYGSAVSMVTATENSINTAFIDMTTSMENGPQKVVDAAERLGHPAGEAPAGRRRASPTPRRASSRRPASRSAARRSARSTWPTPTPPSPTSGRAAEPYIIEKVVDRNGETRYQHKVSDTEAVEQDIAADVSYALQQVVAERLRHRGAGSSAARSPARPAPRPTARARCPRPGSPATRRSCSTSVMYVRGKGNEQLQGWLPSYFGGAYPAETWTAVMQRAMEGLPVEEFPPPAYVDGDAPDEGHEPYTPPPTTQAPPPTTQAAADHASRRRPRSRRPRSRPRRSRPTDGADRAAETTAPTETPHRSRPCRPGGPADRATPDGRNGDGGRDAGPLAAATPAGDPRAVPRVTRPRAGPPHPGRPGRRRAQRGGRGDRSASRAGRHPWWTPVRVRAGAGRAVHRARAWCRRPAATRTPGRTAAERYTHMCYSDLPYLYTGRGFAELSWPYSDDAAGAGAVRRHGVPRRHLLLGVGDGLGHPLAERVARRRPTRYAVAADDLAGQDDVRRGVAAVRRGQRGRLRGARRCSPCGCWPASTGDDRGTPRLVAASPALALTAAHQLGPAGAGVRRRRRCGRGPATGRCSPA